MKFFSFAAVLSLFFYAFTAEGCTPVPILVGTPVEAALAATDCKVNQYLTAAPRTHAENPADAYTLEVSRASVWSVRMTSAEVDSLLYILSPAGASLGRDDNGAGGLDAEIQIQLQPGRYTIVAAGAVATASTGSYRLALTQTDIRSCRGEILEPNAEIERDLLDSDCRNADINSMRHAPGFVDVYSLRVRDRSVVVVGATSSAIDSAVSVINSSGRILGNDDNGGGDRNPLLTISLEPGTYAVLISGRATGMYRIRSEFTAPRTCDAHPISDGETLTGELTESDCRGLDVVSPSVDTTRADRFRLEIKTPRLVRIKQTSPQLDTYLLLMDQDSEVIHRNDDSGDSTDSELALSLPAGVYTILASSYDLSYGRYEISFASEPLRNCSPRTLDVQSSVSGSLTAAGCRFLDHELPSSDTSPADAYRVRVPRRGILSLQSTGAFPAILALSNSDGELLHFEVGEPDATLKILLNPGDYKVMILPVSGAGEYSIRSSLGEPRTCEIVDVAIGSSVDGDLMQSDCSIGDVWAGIVDPDTRVDLIRIDIPPSRTLTIDALSDAFSPAVLLFDSTFTPIRLVLSVNLESSIRFEVTGRSGPHYLLITNLERRTGAWRLSTRASSAGIVQ